MRLPSLCFRTLPTRRRTLLKVRRSSWAPLLAIVLLSGCRSPFAQRIGYDRGIAGAPGTVSLSDPKLYTREALIGERARDVAWIEKLIAESEDPTKVAFKPELLRELEQITAFAAAVGVKYDPASAVTYKRNQATGEIQEEIDVLKLQLQLEQLRRDAELFRSGFANQTAPVNSGAATLGSGGTAATTPISVSSADQLKAAIDKLLLNMTSGLNAKWEPIGATPVVSTPFDDFRDRNAYRDLLKSARNAASLDQLHDSANARLLRLNFQASIVPTEKYAHSLGAVQVKVVPPANAKPDVRFLSDWLDYLNTDTRFRDVGGQLKPHRVAPLLAGNAFRRVLVGNVELVLPITLDVAGSEEDPEDVLRRSQLFGQDEREQQLYRTAIGALSNSDPTVTANLLQNICSGQASGNEAMAVDRYYLASLDRGTSNQYLLLADKVARAAHLTSPITDETRQRIAEANGFLNTASERMANVPQCAGLLAQAGARHEWKVIADSTAGGTGTVRVYDVGPREQVQQISTIARSANSLALAAAIAGSAPGSGVAADAAASYSRQAMGRATALERAPSVVGYSIAGDGVFGWVLGPRAVMDPRGRIEMEQMLKPYDLAVDLSVPGWWNRLDLEITTVWAPAPDLVTRGRLLPGQGATTRQVSVPLVRTVADYDALTEYLVGARARVMPIDQVVGGPVNACTPTTLYVQGDNLWRAQRAFILGTLVERDKITITPDMRGVFITVPAISQAENVNLNRTLYVMTPLGTAEYGLPIDYRPEPSGDACSKPKDRTGTGGGGASGDAVTIAGISPTTVFVPSAFEIRATGTNLTKVNRVELNGQPGILKVNEDGKSLTVNFDEHSSSSAITSENTPLEFLDKDRKVLATLRLRTQRD